MTAHEALEAAEEALAEILSFEDADWISTPFRRDPSAKALAKVRAALAVDPEWEYLVVPPSGYHHKAGREEAASCALRSDYRVSRRETHPWEPWEEVKDE